MQRGWKEGSVGSVGDGSSKMPSNMTETVKKTRVDLLLWNQRCYARLKSPNTNATKILNWCTRKFQELNPIVKPLKGGFIKLILQWGAAQKGDGDSSFAFWHLLKQGLKSMKQPQRPFQNELHDGNEDSNNGACSEVIKNNDAATTTASAQWLLIIS